MEHKYWFIVSRDKIASSKVGEIRVISPIFESFDECKKYRDEVLHTGTICESVFY